MRLRPGIPRAAAAGGKGARPPRPPLARAMLAAPLLGLLASLPRPAAAQAPPPLPGIIERVAPAEPPALGPPLLPPEPQAVAGPGEGRRVAIARAVLLGAQALPEAALRPLFDPLEGEAPTLAEIEAARVAVLRAYRAAGFPYVAVAARLAALPGGGAELRLAVTEGHVAEILLDGDPIGPAERQARRFLEPLVGQRPLSQAALERALLLASDIPGVEARGVLRPMAGEPGALQLLVRLSRRPVSGFASLDNRGNRLTGAWQALLVGQANAFTGLGERTEIALLQSDANGQGFVQLAEELFLGGSGLRLRAHAGAGRSAPGAPFAALGYAGETQVVGIGLSYPLIRSRPLNLGLSAQAEAFESLVETRPAPGEARRRQSRDAVRAVRLGADLAVQDAWAAWAPAAATTTLQFRLHQGIDGLGAAEAGASRTGSEAGFLRLGVEATRVQPLALLAGTWLVAVQGTLAGQWSDDVLPAAERFYLGGARLGRGFHAGQAAGDRAVAGSVEVQLGRVLELGEATRGPRLGTQVYLFRDEGRGFDNGPAGADQRLASWGGGVRLQIDERWQLELEGVRRLTRRPDGAGVAALDEHALFGRLLLRF